MSQATAVVMFHTTADDETGITNPRGNVNITPTPIVAAEFHRRVNTLGTVGDVPNVNAVVVTQTGAPGSSLTNVDVVPGVTPIACGRPKPND
jgi:hypothetical protein